MGGAGLPEVFEWLCGGGNSISVERRLRERDSGYKFSSIFQIELRLCGSVFSEE